MLRKVMAWSAIAALIVLGGMVVSCKPRNNSQISVPSTVSPQVGQETKLTPGGRLIKDKHPQWTDEDCNGIAEKSIHAGMTKEQVTEAWGKPFKVTASTGAQGDQEIWEMHEKSDEYLLFNNGILTLVKQPAKSRM